MILLKNYSCVLERCDENLKRESDESDDRLPVRVPQGDRRHPTSSFPAPNPLIFVPKIRQQSREMGTRRNLSKKTCCRGMLRMSFRAPLVVA